MRLPYILAVLLAIFIAAGLVAENRMSAGAIEMDRILKQAEREIGQGRAGAALAALHRFERRWSKAEVFWGAITDHHEMDQVHLAIDRADTYLAAGNLANAHAEIASLRFLVVHIPEKETLGLRSVL